MTTPVRRHGFGYAWLKHGLAPVAAPALLLFASAVPASAQEDFDAPRDVTANASPDGAEGQADAPAEHGAGQSAPAGLHQDGGAGVGTRPGERDFDGPGERSGLLALFPDAYGLVELRHSTAREMTQDRGFVRLTSGPILLDTKNQSSDEVHWEVRPTIGSTFFDGALDSSFTYIFGTTVGTNELRKYDVVNTTTWTVFSGKFNANSPYTFGPSAFTDLMTGDANGASFSYTDLGFFADANYQMPVPTGELMLRAYLNPSVELYSHQQNQKNRSTLVRSSDGAADRPPANTLGDGEAAAGDQPLAAQVHPMYLAFYGLSAAYKPNANRRLSLGVGFDIIETWRPAYRSPDPGQGGEADGQSGQAPGGPPYHTKDAVSYAHLTLGYEISPRVTLVNVLRHYSGGVFERSIDLDHPDETGQVGPISWENRLSLVINLF